MIQKLTNIRLLATCPAGGGPEDIGAISGAALVWEGDTLRWVGPESELPGPYGAIEGDAAADAGGAVVIPGLIDCHTHLAFGGWREDEFELRSRGASYLDIARAGGGILRTVRDTRSASIGELVKKALDMLDSMLELGMTSVECKSGYGLTLEDELKLLRVYRELENRHPVRIVATLLAAHVVPPEFRDDRQGYVDLISNVLIPRVAREELAAFCDVFVEDSAFRVDEARAVLRAGKAHGLRPKLHVDQLSGGGGARLAADVGAASADHLEFADDAGIEALAGAGVVAVLLPLASLYLSQRPADARRFLDAGVDVAVATDFNPGSAPTYHLPLALSLGCVLNRLTPAAALRAGTINAARAIGRDGGVGSLEPGKKADFVILDTPGIHHFLYHFRPDVVRATYVGGRQVFRRDRP